MKPGLGFVGTGPELAAALGRSAGPASGTRGAPDRSVPASAGVFGFRELVLPFWVALQVELLAHVEGS